MSTTTAAAVATATATAARPAITAYTGVAILTAGDQTVTAYALPGTTGVAVANGSTLSYGGAGVTLANGEVLSLGSAGLVGGQTTVSFSSTSVKGCPVPVSRTRTSRPYTGASGTSASSGGAPSPSRTQSGGASSTTPANATSTGGADKSTISKMHAVVLALLISGTFMI